MSLAKSLKVYAWTPVAWLLLFAGVSKVVGLFWFEQSPKLLFGSATGTSLVAVFEIILAGWLISGIRKRIALEIALATFVAFASFSIFSIRNGDSTCGCMGEASFSPVTFLIVDLIAISLLFVAKSKLSLNRELRDENAGLSV